MKRLFTFLLLALSSAAAAQTVQTQSQALTEDAVQYAARYGVTPDEAEAIGVSLNTVGRGNDMNFARDLKVHHLAASLTQTINTRLIGQITYELGYADGSLGSETA